MLIRISTILGCAVIQGTTAHQALEDASAWLETSGVDMGGGAEALVDVGSYPGRWHRIGLVWNPSNEVADEMSDDWPDDSEPDVIDVDESEPDSRWDDDDVDDDNDQ